jgi:hypothetical protein
LNYARHCKQSEAIHKVAENTGLVHRFAARTDERLRGAVEANIIAKVK